ncbi:TPA: 4Fe-4S binding protein [Thermoplasmata archaeon]|nr:4Fe-4S binding protein [Thermoplasmata archaeon]
MSRQRRGDWTRDELASEFKDMVGRTVPVEIRFEARQKILCFDEVERILCCSRRIVVDECECRAKMGRCDRPVDVCLFLDEGADKQIETGTGKEIPLGQALAILRKTHELGLVHVALVENGTDPMKYICSCCACCCQAIAAMQRFGYHDSLVYSNMIASLSHELCDSCGICEERCNFGALTLEDGKMSFDEPRCFGCGVCTSSCPIGALTLKPRGTLV